MMSDNGSNSELRNTWESAAPGWAKWERVYSAGLEGVTDDLLDMARVSAGARVLDVACCAGAQTLQATRRVGPGGALVACDISGSMLEHVRHNAAAAGLMNIETVESAAESLAETKCPFDAAISRLGLMLFPKLSSAVGAIGRALKPGAKFAALVLPRRPTIRSSHRQWRSFCDTPTSNRQAPASQGFSPWAVKIY
jgi:ubiquinone/menaquinone biosynthesis C-methylase UbiE